MHYEDEQNFRILVQQGEHELKRGAFHVALAYLDKAVRTIPHDLDSRLLRGACLAGVQVRKRGRVGRCCCCSCSCCCCCCCCCCCFECCLYELEDD